jgi:hypothetical protein
MEAQNMEVPPEGILFVGQNGTIMAGFMGQDPQLFAKGKSGPLGEKRASPRGGSRAGGDHGGRYKPWVRAVKGGQPSPGNFLSAAAITDTVNLGTVALRAGCKVTFDAAAMKVAPASANHFLHREYRPDWEI